ncbi:MAG: class B sortase [Intestinibaculum porci]|uniref:class B sortase n=1 Tax=Intestinibaculum porci TaxID=2487118 RepID=UPI002408FF27|nr:class B sortase [Intestinibaculum porci]MDD6422232.1 class B sortase [Intestinibaculum porci]
MRDHTQTLDKRAYHIFNNVIDFIITAGIVIALGIGAFSIFVDVKKTNDLKIGYTGYSMKDLGAVAWLKVAKTDIDFPIMQGKTNMEYLNKNPLGQMDLAGSIFLDSTNSPQFTDPYSVIYGHHLDDGLMFGALDAYLKKSYLEGHTNGTLETSSGRKYQLKLFSCFHVLSDNEIIFNASAQKTTEKVRDYINKQDPNHLSYDESLPIVALSTCVNATSENRVVVFGTIK